MTGHPGILYLENADIPPDRLTALYSSVGWLVYSENPAKMAGLLPGALWHLSAWEGEELLGLIRCVGDDCSILYIQDILVSPAHQRRGIGRQLVEKALARFGHIRQVVLLTNDDAPSRAFYEAVGFTEAGELQTLCFVRFNMRA